MFIFLFYFYFILLYNTVLVLPYIDVNPPRVYMRSQTITTYFLKFIFHIVLAQKPEFWKQVNSAWRWRQRVANVNRTFLNVGQDLYL